MQWEVASDYRFRHVVRSGRAWTGPFRDHTVKVDAHGLQPDRWWYYRFTYRGVRSRIGRTRTAPAPQATPDHLRLGVVSCANLQAGYFSAYRHLAARDDLHAVLHLGDYLYEYGPGDYGMGSDDVDVRKHAPAHEMVSLSDYRRRHGQYKSDRDLQALHAKYPMIATWDDHEVTNDQWNGGAENHQPGEGRYFRRRARAHRAYDEWMPALLHGTARLGDGDRLFRRLRFGRLAELSMLDLRTYRSQQAGVVNPPPDSDGGVSDPDRTITGDAPDGVAQGLARPGPRAVEAGRQPGDDRAGHLRAGAARRARADRRRHRPAARRRPALQRRPVGRLHRRPPRGLRPHPRHRREGRALPHRRHPLRLGLRAAVRRRDRAAVATPPAWSSCAPR